MALSYTKLSNIYKIADGGYFIHSFCYGTGSYTDFIYALLCDQTGAGNAYVAKITKSTLELSSMTKISKVLTTLGAQCLITDGTYLYVICKGTTLGVSGIVINRIACSTMAQSYSVYGIPQDGSSTIDNGVQQGVIGNDKNSPAVSCIYIAEGPGDSTAMRVWKLKNDWSSLPTDCSSMVQGNVWWKGPTNTYINKVFLNGDYLYCTGVTVTSSRSRAMVMRIKQELVGSFSDLTAWSRVMVTPENANSDAYDAAIWDAVVDGNDLWCLGWMRQQNTTAEGGGYDNSKADGLLLRVDISGTNLSIPSSNSVYRIRRSDFSRFKLFALCQDTNNLYLGSSVFPHLLLGGDADYNQPSQLDVIKILKSNRTITWSRQLSDPAYAAKVTSGYVLGIDGAGDDIIFGGRSNIGTGSTSYTGGLLTRIDINSNSNPSTLYDADGMFMEKSVSTISITDVSSDSKWVKTNDTGTLSQDSDSDGPTYDDAYTIASNSGWTSSVRNVDQLSMALMIKPTGDKVTGLTCTGSHYAAVDEDISNIDGDSTFTNNFSTAAWQYDIFSHAAVNDPGGRVTKVEIVQWCRQGTSTANRVGVAWRLGDSGTIDEWSPSTSGSSSYIEYKFDITSRKSGSWSWTDINDLQFGPRLYASFANGTRCTYCWVRVTWESYITYALSAHGEINTTTSNAPLAVGRELSAVAASVVTTATLPLSLLWPLTSAPALVTATSTPAFNVGRELSGVFGLDSAIYPAPLGVSRELSAAAASVTTTAAIPLAVQRELTAVSASVTTTSSIIVNYSIYLTSYLNVVSSTSSPTLFFNQPLTAVSGSVSNTVSPTMLVGRELTAVSGSVLTTKAIELLIAGDKALSALSAMVTSTPAIVLTVQRELASVIASVSNTAGSLSIGRELAAAAGSTSSTSNSVNLEIANAIQLTAAIDTVSQSRKLRPSIARELSAASATVNSTLSVPLTVGRELAAVASIQSFASNFVYLEPGGTICALTAASNSTVTTATISVVVDRMISSACAIASQTSNTVVLMAGKELQANAIMSSWTSPITLQTGLLFYAAINSNTNTSQFMLEVERRITASSGMFTRTSTPSMAGPSRWYETFTPLIKEYTSGVVLRKTTEKEWRDSQ